MPIVAPLLAGHQMRVLIEALDFSCRLDGVTVTLSGEPIDVSHFAAAMKSWIAGTPDVKLEMTGQLDVGTRHGTHAVVQARMGDSTPMRFVVQPEGHKVGGLTLAGQVYVLTVESQMSVGGLLTVMLAGQCAGDVYLGRTVIPTSTAIRHATAGWASTSIDRVSAMPAPFDQVPHAGSLYYQLRNDQPATRIFSIWSGPSAFAQGAMPGSGVKHVEVELAPGQAASGTVGTGLAPASFGRHVAVYVENSAAGETNRAYAALVDEEISLISPVSNPIDMLGGEPALPLLWDDNFVVDFDDLGDVMVAAWP